MRLPLLPPPPTLPHPMAEPSAAVTPQGGAALSQHQHRAGMPLLQRDEAMCGTGAAVRSRRPTLATRTSAAYRPPREFRTAPAHRMVPQQVTTPHTGSSRYGAVLDSNAALWTNCLSRMWRAWLRPA